ncbi:MAG: hypothetical protein ACOYB2_10420 [Limnohabitans sp.]
MAVMTVDAELCRKVGAWMNETVATDEQKVVDADGNDLEPWVIKYPRIDSHTIYATSVLATLPDGVGYIVRSDLLTANGRTVRLGARTVEQVEQRESQARVGPKGAEPFAPEVDRTQVVFGGYELSSALDRLLTGENAGGQFMGRGSAHRACVAHLLAQ